ncbi:MAG TPA: glycosyltransferase, partial [Fimbriimonas sp.]|nr:glycosyltransferase [Fimbriimonas sp.]
VFHLDPAKVTTVYPAVSQDYAKPRPRPQIAGDRPFFLFCSVPDPHKNPEVVIRAVAQAGWDANLVMVSPKDSVFVPPLVELSKELGIEDRVIWTGFVEEGDLIGLFQHALAVISPSQMEGFGLPVGQAMRAGTKVITSNFSAQGEIARNCGLLVDPNSVNEVAAAINSAMAGGISDEMIQAGKRDAQQFDAEVVTRKLIEVYRSV